MPETCKELYELLKKSILHLVLLLASIEAATMLYIVLHTGSPMRPAPLSCQQDICDSRPKEDSRSGDCR